MGCAHALLTRVTQVHRQAFGTEIHSAGVLLALAAMAAVFDWPLLIRDLPTPHMVHEFGDVAGTLLPYLEHAAWPPADLLPQALFEWPPADTLQFQYVLLRRRLQAALARRQEAWWVIDGALVQLVEPMPFAIWLARGILRPRLFVVEEPLLHPTLKLPVAANRNARQALLRKIAATMSQFSPAAAKPHEFQVSVGGLVFAGYPWRRRRRPHAMRQSMARVWRCRLQDPLPGSLAMLVLPSGWQTRLRPQILLQDFRLDCGVCVD